MAEEVMNNELWRRGILPKRGEGRGGRGKNKIGKKASRKLESGGEKERESESKRDV